MEVLPRFVQGSLANAPRSRFCAEVSRGPFATLVHNQKQRSKKCLHLHSELVSSLLKKFATDRETAESDALMLRYNQRLSMTPQKCADDNTAKSCRTANVFDGSTVNDVLIESVDPDSTPLLA